MARPIIVRLCSNGDYWQARWVLPGGRRVSRSLGAKADIPRRAAEVECAKIGREIEKSTAARLGQKAPRLSEFLERYETGLTGIADATLKLQRLVIGRLREFFAQDPRIDAITAIDAADFHRWVSTHKFRRGDEKATYTLSEPSVGRHITIAKQILETAVDEERIARNPFGRIRVAQVRSDKAWAVVSMPDLDRILDACPSSEFRLLFALARLAGLRLGEAIRLQWSHIDWDAHRLTVVNPGQKQTTKARTRFTPIQPKLYAMLRETYDAAPSGDPGPCCKVDRRNLYRVVKGIMERAQVPAYADPFHTLRRNLQTEWLDEHPEPLVVAWLGNSARVAREFYHRSRAESEAKVTGKIEAPKEAEA